MTIKRSLLMATISTISAILLHSYRNFLPSPPITDFTQLENWWNTHGTAVAAFSIARMLGLVLCCYLAILSISAMLAAITRWQWMATFTKWLATPALRRIILSGSLAATLTTNTASAATVPVAYPVASNQVVSSQNSATIGHTDVSETSTDASKHTDTSEVSNVDNRKKSTNQAAFAVTDVGTAIPSMDFKATDIGAVIQLDADKFTLHPSMDFKATDIGAVIQNHDLQASASPEQDPATTTTETGKLQASASPEQDPATTTTETGKLQASASPEQDPAKNMDSEDTNLVDPSLPIDTSLPIDSKPYDLTALTAHYNHEVWLVQPGDNLWGIAANTVFERTGHTEPKAVTQYWLDLIETNSETLNGKPDLIHPGQIIHLPG